MVLTPVNIMVQSMLLEETQVILNISCLLEIGPPRYGKWISIHQSCKPDIIQLTLLTVAGHQQDAVFSS